MKCLIVDDEELGRELLTIMLANYVDGVDTAKDGAEAVKCFAKALEEGKPYNLVCLDIIMPIMSGHEALKQMRNLEKKTGSPNTQNAVIVMTTALDSLEDIQEAIWQGDCDDYLAKPISKADILTLLNKHKLLN